MGSLPHHLSSSSSSSSDSKIDETTLLRQTLAFTRTLFSSSGTIFFSGIGKSGIVANKISQTLVSLSILSAFLSAVDALHSDIGILSSDDVVVLFSKSGNTDELLHLAPCVRAKGAYLISLTSIGGGMLFSS